MYRPEEIIQLRRRLHRLPEVSHNEYRTAEIITGFLRRFKPDDILHIGRTGRAFVFRGKRQGPVLVFRAELDGLPIEEESTSDHASGHPGVSHACGHDGHMAIVAGLAAKIAENRPLKGQTVLLFQPAEEVEQGAAEVAADPVFLNLKPDYIFALHNIPGFPMHEVLVREGCFSAASRGMTVKLFGRTSHAAEPENGINPVFAIEKIIRALSGLKENAALFTSRVLLTFIHIRLGEIAFGTSPGYAEIMATLRTFNDEDMTILATRADRLIAGIAAEEQLRYDISFSEEFPVTDNDPECVDAVRTAASENGLSVHELKDPFRWSEDFAYYTEIGKTALFGLGSGAGQPQLHNPNFDFPDEILETGIDLFYSIYKKIQF